jgi:hypothetical protein
MINPIPTKIILMKMKKSFEILQFKSGNLLRLLSLTIILAFIMPVMTNAQGKANFAGNWVFNASKSNMGTPPAGGGGGGGGGGRGGFGAGDFVAAQDASTLTVTTTRTGQDGTPTKRESKYTLDGKENTLAAPTGGGGGGGTPAKYVATWSADGKTLTIATTRTTQNGEMKSTDVWTLTSANTLSRTSTSNFGGTERKTVAVYDKK